MQPAQTLPRLIEERLARGDTRPGTPLRLSLAVPRTDPVRLLLQEATLPQVLWSSRDAQHVIAAIGAVAEARTDAELDALLRLIESAPNGPRLFGGLAFDPRSPADLDWAAFGSLRFILPQFELSTDTVGSVLSVHFLHPVAGGEQELMQGIESALKRLRLGDVALMPPELPQLVMRTDQPNREVWEAMVAAALKRFSPDGLTKVVLARKARIAMAGGMHPALLPARSMVATRGLYHFAFMFEPGSAFFGATPERLYRREGRRIWTEALAGTRPRGDSQQVDSYYGDLLQSNQKELVEHRQVVEFLQAVLAGLCTGCEVVAQEELMKLAHVQHLYTRIQGELLEGVRDRVLLERLHPTPAVGGSPRQLAMAAIRELEAFARGWYAGPIGWLTRDAAEFAVGIRSGLIRGNTLDLFAGNGIVAGSEPQREWQENEAKLRHFFEMFTAARPAGGPALRPEA